jgi:3-phenylpropionate/trans-cinnamate dioxygenase ferredoxin reductase subunit
MSVLHVKYLIVGGGVAGSAAADAIRAIDPQGELAMVGRESIRPYHRPPLSKTYLRRRSTRAELFVQPAGWYAEQRIQLRTGVRAAHLDVARRVVTLESGEGISFGKLLLATGMSPLHLNVPGADLPNVYYLRTLDDAERIGHAIEKARHEGTKHPSTADAGLASSRGRVTIIGAGFLGVELAATMTQIGLAVDLVAAHAHPWDKFAGEHTGKFLAHYLEQHGVICHAGRRPLRVEGDGRVQRVVLDDDAHTSLACDFVIAAVGAVTNKELLRGTSINAEKAILVDNRCRTNVPDIFAAGDCAAIFDPLFGKHRIIDHWDHAKVTGAIAGTNMAGGDVGYEVVNHFFSDVFELSLSGWGEPKQVDRRLIRGSTTIESPDFIEIGIAADGRVAQVLAINHAGEDALLRDLVGNRVRVDGHEEALKDPAFPLASLLP